MVNKTTAHTIVSAEVRFACPPVPKWCGVTGARFPDGTRIARAFATTVPTTNSSRRTSRMRSLVFSSLTRRGCPMRLIGSGLHARPRQGAIATQGKIPGPDSHRKGRRANSSDDHKQQAHLKNEKSCLQLTLASGLLRAKHLQGTETWRTLAPLA